MTDPDCGSLGWATGLAGRTARPGALVVADPDCGSLGWAMALAVLTAAPVQIVVATEYLSVEAAQKALFPQADLFSELVLSLNAAQRQQVATLAGPQPPHRRLRA